MAVRMQLDTTDKITVTNPQTITDSNPDFSFCCWVRQTSTPNGAWTSSGSNKGANDLLVFVNGIGWFSNVLWSSSFDETRITNANLFPDGNDSWTFIAVTFSKSNNIQFYVGTPTTAPTKPTQSISSTGTGTVTTNSGDLYLGNRGAANALSLNWDWARAHWISKELTLAEVQSCWMRDRPLPETEFLFDIGGDNLSTIYDLSDNKRNGTGTGLAATDHANIPPLIMSEPLFTFPTQSTFQPAWAMNSTLTQGMAGIAHA